MLEHYIIQALRSFWRFRVTAAVNLLGLVLAVVCFIATYLFLDSLVRADVHFAKASRTYLITQELWIGPSQRIVGAVPTTGPPAAANLRVDFPGLEAVARAVELGHQSVATDDRKADVIAAAIDPDFLEIFDLDFKAGEPAAAMSSAHSAILTQRTAERLFGSGPALGRRILLQNRIEVTVTGVIGAIPQPSHMGDTESAELVFDILVPMPLVNEIGTRGRLGPVDPDDPTAWGSDAFFTYVLFPADRSFTPQELIAQLPAFAERRANRKGSPLRSVFGAVPVSHLMLAYADATITGNTMSVATMIFLLDAMILAIACVNYSNLAVAIATTRAKEIGVRKVLGATNRHLLRQYLVEAALLGITAVCIVVVLAVLAIEPVNRLLDMDFTFASLLMPQLWLMVAGLIAAISVMGGLYPALALSRVPPVEALRAGNVRAGPRFVPTLLVGAQFAAASFLLVVALVTTQQNGLLKKEALQTDRDPVVVLQNNINELRISFDTLRDELLQDPNIKAVSSVSTPPWQNGGSHVSASRSRDARAASEITILNQVNRDVFQTLGLQLLAGRLLDPEHGDEFDEAYRDRRNREIPVVIDRALAAALGWHDPNEAVGKIAYGDGIPLRVVGVVENGYLRLEGPNTSSNMYSLSPRSAGLPVIRVAKENVPEAVQSIERVWERLAPKVQLRREFMDALFERAYQNYSRITAILNGLAVFAFFIAIMGLCGLAIHVTQRRQREIGIRKTLGATVRGVVTMLLIDFAKPVLIANLIAWPFAWYVGQQYLSKFVQRHEITIWPFVLSLVITVGVAWAAVGVQALRAATVKPAKVLYAQ